jgi:hypothetical protein
MTRNTFHKVIAISAAMATATAITSAEAIEATQFVAPPGIATRVQAGSDPARNLTPTMQRLGEASEFVDAASTLARASAKSRDKALALGPQVVRFGEATEFIDPAGTRSRADVLAEPRGADNLLVRAGSHTVD